MLPPHVSAYYATPASSEVDLDEGLSSGRQSGSGRACFAILHFDPLNDC